MPPSKKSPLPRVITFTPRSGLLNPIPGPGRPGMPPRGPILPPVPGRRPAQMIDPVTGQSYQPIPPRLPEPWAPEDRDPYRGDPIHLTATCTLPSMSSDSPNIEALRNPLGGPMEVLEIKFGLFVTDNSGAGSGAVSGATVGCSLTLGEIPLTAGFVPAWLFGREDNVGAMQFQGQGATGYFAYAEYRWKLTHPLFVPTGWVLTPTFQHFGQIKPSVTVRVSLAGRALPVGTPKPKLAKLPYVASWQSKSFTTFGAADSDTSRETDLVNKSGKPVTLHRLVGRVAGFHLTNAIVATSDDSVDGVLAFSSRLATLKMIDSLGNVLIRDATLFGSVFSRLTRTWEVGPGVIVPPNWYAIANLSKAAPVVTPSGTFLAQAHIAAVGTQEVAL